ncbi:hypothetical protein O3G_MSEX003082 [Manduca sexta]|uniref:Ig-like domain-containing protein n=2 Tax=Manduca sexta TaxID=7130 RepID=A0A922CF47_MANSE|nr:hypothetical protein O3G_MSEX003082 [Manduca sexta]
MNVGSKTYILRPGNQDGDVVYSGQGLSSGECGAHIRNVREEWNGNISCVLPPQTGNIEIKGTMRLLVAMAPGEPILVAPPQTQFNEGDLFMARCVAPNGRPAAKITWFLDEDQILEGVHQPIVTEEPDSDLQTISQNISRTLRADDNGKMLLCKVEHEALDQPREPKRQLVVHYPPKRLESGAITIFGLKLGAEGALNVTVRANPPPTAEWTIGGIKLTAPQSSENPKITAFAPIHMGRGYYNVTLRLDHIAKEDVERTYYLAVSNDLGREEFAVRISTMDEPAGVELGTGSIVGIVVAVLLLLIGVSLAVFAFATDRWCFAGRGSHHTKNSGESSDTESAVGRERSRLSALSARFRSVLPRAKDKVQATETAPVETEEKPLSEDKKNVVYAELALGEQTSGERPPPPSTEYAEIVYTDQTGQKEVKE